MVVCYPQINQGWRIGGSYLVRMWPLWWILCSPKMSKCIQPQCRFHRHTKIAPSIPPRSSRNWVPLPPSAIQESGNKNKKKHNEHQRACTDEPSHTIPSFARNGDAQSRGDRWIDGSGRAENFHKPSTLLVRAESHPAVNSSGFHVDCLSLCCLQYNMSFSNSVLVGCGLCFSNLFSLALQDFCMITGFRGFLQTKSLELGFCW